MAENWIDEVLSFWFEEVGPERWFESSPELDETIRQRFGALHDKLASDLPHEVVASPRGALAAAIVLDQFPRNMYRGTAKAFATDDLAIRLARQAIESKVDEHLTPAERLFLYMPFQHSEILADQEHAVMLFKALGQENALRYAIEHRDIIARFGRFPHRNRALGRQSTPEEEVFLQEHKGFGQ